MAVTPVGTQDELFLLVDDFSHTSQFLKEREVTERRSASLTFP